MEPPSVHRSSPLDPLPKSGQQCGYCGVDIRVSLPDAVWDVALLQVVTATTGGGEGVSYKVETAEDNDFLFAPHFFCMTCWEEITESIDSASKDHAHHRTIYLADAVVRCDQCNSGIAEGEIFATICSGALCMSVQTPSGHPETDFVPTDKMPRPEVLCIGCMKLIDSEIKELWSSDVSQGDECDEGTYSRCWRRLKCEDCIVR